jgi:ATP-binding cassette subfamily B protein
MSLRARKFFSYYRPYWRLALADIACAALVSAVTLALPLCARYVTQVALDKTLPNPLDHVYVMGGVMLGLVVLYAIANTFVDYQGHMMGARMERDMRAELFDHYQKLSFGFYDEQKTGQLMTRLTNDVFWLSELFHHGPEDLIIAFLTFIGAFGILIAIDVELTLIVFAFLPVMAVYAFYFNKRMNIALRRSHDRVGDINAQIEDTLAGIRVVQSFANEDVETRKFAAQNNRFLRSRGDGYWSEAYLYTGITAFTQVITIAVIVFGAVAISSASLDPADLVTYLMCVGIMVEPIRRALNLNRLFQEGITGFARFMEMLEVRPDIVNAPDAADLADVRGDLSFRSVSFKYQDGHAFVLKDISLDIRAGEYVALVGSSGVGKTTLCSLVPRFYEVTSGEILLEGINIKDVTLHSLRRNIGVVQQDVYLFSGTVADNIGYGRPGATREEIVEAAKRANAHDFVMALPDGYDTDIGQRGVKLSGGQKQRISIARVFLKDPPVLIFDEATSALDNESEKAVQGSLEALAHNRTTLVIAHRLSTIQRAHRIIVLTDSGIEEQGTHEELLARGGAYARLYNVQSVYPL